MYLMILEYKICINMFPLYPSLSIFIIFYPFYPSSKAAYIHRKRVIHKIPDLEVAKLQQFVRGSWVSNGKASPAEQRFVQMVVAPAISVNVDSIPDSMSDIVGRLQILLNSDKIDDHEIANIRVASASIKGALSQHPIVQGLCLQAYRLVEKKSRGICHMSGRRSTETDVESAMIADAGMQLSMLGGNAKMMQEFGLPASPCRLSLDELEKLSLPSPALAVQFPEVLRNNWVLADQRYRRPPQTPKSVLSTFQYVSNSPMHFSRNFDYINMI